MSLQTNKNGPVAKRQSSISNFFAAPGKKPQKLASNSQIANYSSLTTPEKKLGLKRSDSILSRASQNDGFEDIQSSDTSFDSPEINNFRTKVLPEKQLSQSTAGVEIEYISSYPKKRNLTGIMQELGRESIKAPRLMKPKAPQRPLSRSSGTSSVDLSKEQLNVITQIVDNKKNVFYTGSAGTGKSVVLRDLVRRLYSKYGSEVVGVTASTGLAACNIGGQTIHRYLGIGIGAASAEALKNIIEKKPAFRKKWQRLRVLIIDEISMIDGALFTKLDALARLLRGRDVPFGGIQVVCTGDFFQLPPVSKNGQAQYCFESKSWSQVIQRTLLLTQVFRQKGDNELIDMLNALRFGSLESPIVSKFLDLQRVKKYEDGIEPTELFPTREEVKRANERRLQSLGSQSVTFTAEDSTSNEFDVKLLENLMCERVLTLKPGAQVMYLKNRDDGIVNGSIGKVLFFTTPKLFYQIDVIYDFSYCDDPALLQEISIITSKIGNRDATMTAAEQVAFDSIPPERQSKFLSLLKEASLESKDQLFPVVNFKSKGDVNTVIHVTKEEFTLDVSSGSKREISRTQLPLLLSWAMSIHKSQGQTIQRLRVDLKRIFEKGQVYVALSRAVDKDNLEIRNFDPQKIIASDKVKQFYEQLEKAA